MVLAENVGGKTFDKLSDFHAKLGITRKSPSVRKDDAWYSLYCFADHEHAKNCFKPCSAANCSTRRNRSFDLPVTVNDPTESGLPVDLLWWCFWIESQVPTTWHPEFS